MEQHSPNLAVIHKPIIEILVGPIASGKSTYSQKRALEGAIIINDDSIVNAIHCNYYKLYDMSLKPLYKAVENTILQIAILSERDVIVDRPNYSKATRRRYIGIAKSLDAAVHAIIMPTVKLEEHARRRTNSDNRGYNYEHWLMVANTYYKQYEDPELSEGFDVKKFITNQDIEVWTECLKKNG